jgi:cysteine desulfuration protein SufE
LLRGLQLEDRYAYVWGNGCAPRGAIQKANTQRGQSMSLEEIRSNFELLDDWEDRYRYVIELGRALPPLDAAFRTEATKVRGCASQVWLVSRAGIRPDGAPQLVFSGDSDAHIVRGLIAILLAAIEGKSIDELRGVDLQAVFAGLGLQDHLTPQRSNGLASMIERIRADAKAAALLG